MARPDNPRFPHTCEITHVEESDDPMQDEGESITIYQGCCRSSAQQTTNDSGEVITSTRRLSIPLKRADWKKGVMGILLIIFHLLHYLYYSERDIRRSCRLANGGTYDVGKFSSR